MAKAQKTIGRPRCFEKDSALDAALGVFLRKGYEGCSIDDLTNALGINRPSLYSAFGNKEELFITVMRKYHGVYQSHMEKLLSKGLPPKKTIEEWLSWFLENYRKQESELGCLLVNSTLLASDNYPRISEELKKFHDLNEQLLRDYFIAEVANDNFSGDPIAMSQYFNAVVQGMAVIHRSQKNYKALENIAANALQILN